MKEFISAPPRLVVAALSSCLCASEASANGGIGDRADGHGPIGVMADHRHDLGEVMLSYRYMNMRMGDSRDRTDKLSDAEVLADFPITPTDMTMEMHMFGLMYAPVDRVTLTAMVPYTGLGMDHVTRTGVRFRTESDGIGDVRLGALVGLATVGHHKFHANLRFSAPTGSIDERDDTPAGVDQKLPYPMQLGSGTWDLLPGLTYTGWEGQFSWGAQANATLRLGENDNEYTLGDRYGGTVWIAHSPRDWFSASFRIDATTWGDIDGADPELNPAVVPTADPDLRAGTRVDLGLGVNFLLPSDEFGHRFAFEFLLPVHENLDGPQLETDWTVWVGYQKAF